MLRPGVIDYGSTMQLTATWRDEDGELIDPTAVSIQTLGPSGSKATYTFGTDTNLIQESDGVYSVTFTADKPGRWRYRWKAVSGQNTLYKEGRFEVQHSEFYEDEFSGDYREYY